MHNSDSLEDNLRVSYCDNENTPTTNVEYLAKPENYSGSDLHSIRLQVFARHKLQADGDANSDVWPAKKLPTTSKPRLSLRHRGSSLTADLSPLHVQLLTLNRRTPARVRKASANLRLLQEINDRADAAAGVASGAAAAGSSAPAPDEAASARLSPPATSEMTPKTGSRQRVSDVGFHRESVSESAWAPPQLAGGHRLSTVTPVFPSSSSSSEPASTRVRRFTRTSAPFVPAFTMFDAKGVFRRVVRVVIIAQMWISNVTGRRFKDMNGPTDESSDSEKQIKLLFDVSFYKAEREITLSNEVKSLLSLPSGERTREQIQTICYSLQHLQSFSVYPIHMQHSLCKVAWYQRVPPKTVIIRQGHYAESFYFILAGKARATIMERNAKTGETVERFGSWMKKGASFGELALLHHSQRTATVSTSEDRPVELLVIDREDFFDIFMRGHQPGQIPEHIKFIRPLRFMTHWPLQLLVQKPQYCLLHFFTRNTTITKNGAQSEWIYIIKWGSCKVMAELKHVVPRLGLRKQDKNMNDVIVQRSLKLTNERRASQGSPYLLSPTGSDKENTPVFNNNTPVSGRAPEKMQVPLQVLKPKDVYGLQYVDFSEQAQDTVPTSLVSNGAECVMLSKKFFMDHAPPECRRNLAEVVVPWPEQDTLQRSAQTDADWQLFKNTFVNDVHLAYSLSRPHTAASLARPINALNKKKSGSRPTTAAR